MGTKPKPLKKSPHVESMLKELRAYKPPWWRRWLLEFKHWNRARLARKAPKQIAIIVNWKLVTWRDKGEIIKREIVPTWVYCLEKAGQRYYRLEYDRSKINNTFEASQDWHDVVRPWINRMVSNSDLIRYADRTRRRPSLSDFGA